MTILHVDTGREMRGGQYQVLLLMEALARRGHTQLLLAPAQSALLAAAQARGLPSSRLGWRLPQSESPDMIHAHDARAHTHAALQAGRTPVVVARRVGFPVRRGFLSRWKYAKAAHFIAVSEFVRSELLQAGVAEEKVTVVYDGVRLPDMARAAEIRAAYRRGHNLWPELFVAGTMGPPAEKPLWLFLEAAALRPGLRALVEAPSDPSPFLFALDAFVYLSESEGLGSAILLAMAHGLPVIASRVGGIPEIVRHRETGLLVENSVEEVEAALDELREDALLRWRLGQAAREWVARSVTDDIMAAATEAVYRKVLPSGA